MLLAYLFSHLHLNLYLTYLLSPLYNSIYTKSSHKKTKHAGKHTRFLNYIKLVTYATVAVVKLPPIALRATCTAAASAHEEPSIVTVNTVPPTE